MGEKLRSALSSDAQNSDNLTHSEDPQKSIVFPNTRRHSAHLKLYRAIEKDLVYIYIALIVDRFRDAGSAEDTRRPQSLDLHTCRKVSIRFV